MKKWKSKEMDHLGLVATMCDHIGLVQLVDKMIPPDVRTQITVGECVKLMVINGLGFTSRPLYLEAQFFSSKPVTRLLGRELDAEDISDDRLGRALDACYEANCDALFSNIASRAATRCNVNQKFRHFDTTSMCVQGDYDEGLGLIQFGYSKDGRPDLKQWMLSLMCSQDHDIPLLAQVLPGNTSDKTHFRELLKRLKTEIQESPHTAFYVADSALYTEKTIKEISSYTSWLTRVPENVKAAKQIIQQVEQKEMHPLDDGYWGLELGAVYGGVRQRWLVIYSEASYQREKQTVDKRVNREATKSGPLLKEFTSQRYSCKNDAEKSIARLEKKLRYHRCISEIIEQRSKGKPGRPRKDEAIKVEYKLSIKLIEDKKKIEKALQSKGKWIVATNELDASQLSLEEMLVNYKAQQSVERGFRFLKDPLFLTSSVFLKNQKRIVALGMIMCLCLLVYSLTQRLLRQKLEESEETLPNQTGRPTQRPTLKWVFQVFEGIHVLFYEEEGIQKEDILNMKPFHINVIRILGPPYEKMYRDAA